MKPHPWSGTIRLDLPMYLSSARTGMVPTERREKTHGRCNSLVTGNIHSILSKSQAPKSIDATGFSFAPCPWIQNPEYLSFLTLMHHQPRVSSHACLGPGASQSIWQSKLKIYQPGEWHTFAILSIFMTWLPVQSGLLYKLQLVNAPVHSEIQTWST